MLGSHSASPDLCRLPSNFNAAADIFMECLSKCLQGDQTRFTSTITTTTPALCCARGAQQHRAPSPGAPRERTQFRMPFLPPAQGLGEVEMNQTRSLPTKSPQSAGAASTHINYAGPGGWGPAHGYRYERQAGPSRGRGSYFSIRVRVKNEAKDGALQAPPAASTLLAAPLPRRAPGGLDPSPPPASGSQQPPLSPWGALLGLPGSRCCLPAPHPSSPCQRTSSSFSHAALPQPPWRPGTWCSDAGRRVSNLAARENHPGSFKKSRS